MKPFLSNYRELKRSAIRREMTLTITFIQFKKFTKITECHYCSGEIDWSHKRRYYLDRKNNRNGYYLANVVVCCSKCNRLKGTEFKYSEFKRLAKTIRKVIKK